MTAAPASNGALMLSEPVCAAPLLRARSRPPRLRPGLIARPRLVRLLVRAPRAPVALLVAPAGYGKTTVLSEWDAQDERPFAWVSLDESDNDPARLMAHVACALDPIQPILVDVLEALSEARAVVLALDDVHVLHEPAALAAVSAMARVLRPESQLALASRSEPALPIGRLRAHGDVAELRTRDLALTTREAGAILNAAALDVGLDDVRELVRRTEGWPAGLYLAALSLGEQSDIHEGVARFAGDDRYVAEYVRDEFLAELSPAELLFLTRTSTLDDLSGPLCDFVLEAAGSGGTLARLARSNLLLVPLDRSDGWYRCNGLLAEMLRAELHRREPDREVALHRRASAWFGSHGDSDRAVQHAVEGHDVRRAGDLMWRNVFRYVGPDRDGALRRRLDRFTDEEIAGCPPLALVAANRYLVTGAGNQAEHWASAATAGAARAPRGTRVAVAGGIAIMRAAIARDGIACMAEDAGRAYRLEPDGSPWRSVSRLIEGVACHLAADRIRARAYLEEGLRAAAVQAPFIHALCLAQLTLLALEEDDWESGAWLAARAKALVESAGVAELPSAALVFAVSAAVRAHSGHVEAATGDRRQASKLLAGLKDFAPWYDAEARIALARAALRLSDPVSARGLLAEAARALRQTPDAVVLGQWLDQVSAQADATEGSSINSGWSLTTAELRVLQFLPSHLSFPSIAERLYVSPNTVKTHVRAIYRKFDASSREQAVETARHGGLLDLSGAT